MKLIIPEGRSMDFNFPKGMVVIPSSKVNPNNIIILTQGVSNSIGVLTKVPNQNLWFFTDISKTDNIWSGSLGSSPKESIDIFIGSYNNIYEFDSLLEFSEWLATKTREKEQNQIDVMT